MKEHVRQQTSIQRDMLRLRETWGEMLCLYAPGSPTRRSYRAVLQVTPINLSLKAEDEQEAIIERFAALIKSLSFPLQILVRNRRQDLTPYIQRLLAHPEWDGQHPPTWYALAHSQAELLQKIAAERTLIERHVYLIIPASQGTGGSRRSGGMPALFGTRRAQRIAQTQEQARQELALRAEALAQQLSSCGLTCQRLHNADLARLYYECLTPDRASAHPLSDDILSSVGQPTRVQRRSQRVPQSRVVRTTVGGENHAAERGPALKASPAVLAVAAPAQAPPAKREDAPSPPQPDLLHLVDLLAPECIEITPDALRIGQDYACGIAVTACPREVSFDGWLRSSCTTKCWISASTTIRRIRRP